MNDAGPSSFKLSEQTAEWGIKLWTLTFDLPGEKVNKLNRQVMMDFSSVLSQLEELGKAGSERIEALLLVSGKPGNFIAGADIEMIQKVRTASEAEELSATGQALMSRWEDLPFPTVAAVGGNALGGGCEWALASTAIVMSDDSSAKIGLPEVMLGLIPGMGGCVRLPQKVGLATAFDMILTGKTLSGERAFRAGMVEAVLPKQSFEADVCRWVKANLKSLQSGKRLAREPKLGGMGGVPGALLEKTPMGRSVIIRKAKEGVLAKTRGHYPAPLEAIEVIQSCGLGYGERLRGSARERAMAREAKGFGTVASTEVSRNLIRIFFLTEGVKKSTGLPLSSSSVKPLKVKHAAVLGAGVMGGGIAQLLAEKNIGTRMKDLNTPALSTGVQAAAQLFQKQVQKKKINKRQFLQKMNLISPVLDFSGFRSVDAVIEAVVEKMELKQQVFRELEAQVREDCVIVSNTSSLSISEMQSVLKRPERFAGMHFFNPVHRMPLVEVIRGTKSSDEAVATVFQLSKQLGKTPVVVKDAPGFLVNRLLVPYLNEAAYMVAEGVPIPELDQALLVFGMPMGPMELVDEVGVDVGEKVLHILHLAFGGRMEPAPLTPKLIAAGRLGKKNGKGMYTYSGKGKWKDFDPKVYEILGVTPRFGTLATEEMVERCVLPMINEASRCLEEGIVSSAAEVDLGMIMGTGFPPFRGGLLRYADALGAQTVVDRLRKYQELFGIRFEPAPALLARAARNEKFYSK